MDLHMDNKELGDTNSVKGMLDNVDGRMSDQFVFSLGGLHDELQVI